MVGKKAYFWHRDRTSCNEKLRVRRIICFLSCSVQVWFLDKAKSYKIIRHNPCLFNRDSGVKSSRDVLTALSRDFLSGEGDVVKHLSYLGYVVNQEQTVLDEFDYAVTNVAVDLKDGVRLW